MKTKNPTNRYSTEEVAVQLFCSPIDARVFLKVARVPHCKAGNCYLWDAETVDRLINNLGIGLE